MYLLYLFCSVRRFTMVVIACQILLQETVFAADHPCPHITEESCPLKTLDSGDVVQLVVKTIPSSEDFGIPPGLTTKRYYCATPDCLSSPCHLGWCEETMEGYQCHCPDGSTGKDCPQVRGQDCFELHKGGVNISGVYPIYRGGASNALNVYCDMETDGGGWTVFQRRQDGSVDFNLGWSDYKSGFGNVAGEHWLGNDNIHRLSTQNTYELRVDLEDFEGETRYASYNRFTITNEATKYILTIGVYSGNAGDSLSYHQGSAFSTKDVDNDDDYSRHCAVNHNGAWWYKACLKSSLNGQYLNGVVWAEWRGYFSSLKKTEMKIRPVS